MPGDVTPTTTERDYLHAIRNARTLTELRGALAPWARFAPSALRIADGMTDGDFKEFRDGFLTLFEPDSTGEVRQNFQYRYGDLMTPPELLEASKKAHAYRIALGTVLLGATTN